MLEPAINPRDVSDLAATLVERAAACDPAIHAERDLFDTLARAYFRDRERALAGPAVPFTTLMLEAARMISDHRLEEAMRHGTPPRPLSGDARVHHVITGVLDRLPPERAFQLADAITGIRPFPGTSLHDGGRAMRFADVPGVRSGNGRGTRRAEPRSPARPDTARPAVARPAVARAEMARAEMARADMARADMARPGVARADMSRTDAAA
ncbi:hypothetical protein [Actinoplanes sp. NPDC051494]|uniref:hypothetical protein n=1 Tax=Actinoplanes sp. NPDC051494 TaxID=3363907 RepID=UPI0037A8A9B8